MYTLPKIERFKQHVELKYTLYNSLFATMPYEKNFPAGTMLPLFSDVCEKGYRENRNPQQIFDIFINQYLNQPSENEQIDLMFSLIQLIERQVVLFDAVEEAAFSIMNNMEGKGSLRAIKENAEAVNKRKELQDFLEHFKVRAVLTAHPTQFYPDAVLVIITELVNAIKQNDHNEVKTLLAQLNKTPFIKKHKPTPYDEAVSLVWYLEHVFYPTIGEMLQYIQKSIFREDRLLTNDILNLGFWPGGDRDGNPFVTTEITIKVAHLLRKSILRSYLSEVSLLTKKLTFVQVDVLIKELEQLLFRSVYNEENILFISLDELIQRLNDIRNILVNSHQSLYLEEVESLIRKVKLFGFHFATIDIRENSKVHKIVFKDLVEKAQNLFPDNYFDLQEADKIKALAPIQANFTENDFKNPITQATISSLIAVKTIQEFNGEKGCNRYIISNNNSALNVLETLAMFKLCGFVQPKVDIVPLFESIQDLYRAGDILEKLYTNEVYKQHLENRGNIQTVMLGFSDGTKDGGYLMANWAIYQTKEALTEISRKYNIKIVFFDGRGGPPARGGGKTHQFYASLGSQIENEQIQITIQGQTVSANFGNRESCKYNLENLISAAANNQVFHLNEKTLTADDKEIMNQLAQLSYQKYIKFKNHPLFIPYLERMSTLNYYAKTNIGSRPSKRNTTEQINLDDLRAIPFVGAWSQLKQNVPGFFGVGTALRYFEDHQLWHKVETLYNHSLFFKTLLDNSMMALSKSYFPLTQYLENDAVFGAFWGEIFEEYKTTKRLLLKISGMKELLDNYPDVKVSIQLREKIVLPLLTMQQLALMRINELKNQSETEQELLEKYEKIVIRSLFGSINAGRNSV